MLDEKFYADLPDSSEQIRKDVRELLLLPSDEFNEYMQEKTNALDEIRRPLMAVASIPDTRLSNFKHYLPLGSGVIGGFTAIRNMLDALDIAEKSLKHLRKLYDTLTRGDSK